MSATLSLLKCLVAEPSVTPHAGRTFELIDDYLRPLGFNLEYMNEENVTNLWATHGSGAPLFCFAGHLDVVPTGPLDKWTFNPFIPTEHAGYLYGRGTTDMKASIAAILTAVEALLKENGTHVGTLALLLTSDEEGPAKHGTKHVVETLAKRGIQIDYCLVGEPTCDKRLGDIIKHGRRGSLSGKLTIHGTQGHIAYPHLADNPIHRFAPALAELASTTWDQGTDFFAPTAWQVSNIQSGTGVANVIPGTVEVMFNFRHAPISTPDSLKERFNAILQRHELRYDILWGTSIPYLSTPGPFTTIAQQAIETVTGVTPILSTSGGTSDGRFISRICNEVIEFGPVNETIHKIDECICIEDIHQLHTIYHRILTQALTQTLTEPLAETPTKAAAKTSTKPSTKTRKKTPTP